MKKAAIVTAMALLGILMLFSGSGAGFESGGLIEGLVAMDAPNDSGQGVILKWKPLDKSHRIIQYKIYRGASPDSLFYFNNLDVDPVLGVIGNEITFSDQDYQPLFEFETAPNKLKKERHQPSGSPLYRAVPRDPKVIGSLIPHFEVLGAINHRVFNHHSRRIDSADGSMAGYKLNQFDFIYANPLPGKTYYYSVVAVNERGKHLPGAKVVSATPVDNRPSPDAELAATWVEDKAEIGFEWSMPEMGYDLQEYSGWLLPKDQAPLFKAQQELNSSAPDSLFNAQWKASAIPMFQVAADPNVSTLYQKVNLKEAGIQLSRPATEYLPLLTYSDTSGFQNASLADTLYVKNSSQYPPLPAFSVHNKKNNKGDNLLISVGKPVAYITQASYTSGSKTKLKFNYDLLENELYPIERLRFTFTDTQGKELATITEYYPDKILYLKVPQGFKGTKKFMVSTRVMLRSKKAYVEPAATQDIVFDDATRRYVGKNLSLHGHRLDKVYLDVLTRKNLDQVFKPGMRSNGMLRAQDHTISFPDVLYKSVTGYDAKTRSLTIDPTISVAMNAEKGFAFQASLYRSDFEKDLKEMSAKADSLRGVVKQLAAQGDTLSQAYLAAKEEGDYYSGSYGFITAHPAYKQAQKARSESAWRRILLAESVRNNRSFSYQFLLTDGHGFFQQTDTYNRDGETVFTPKPVWFNTTMWATLFGSIIFGILIVYALFQARRKDLYIRPIAGLEDLDNAVGRATEMGRPVMFVPGWGTLGEPCTISFLMILSQIAKKTAEFDVRLISPHVDYFVVPIAQEIVQTSYSEVGRPDAFNREDIFFISDSQFAFAAGVNGITIRERVATIMYMGYFNAEALLMTETGNQTGAIQIAGTDAITQVPFFITTCDYTLIGEEFYAASAYLSKNVELVSMLKGQDYFKMVMITLIVIGSILSTFHWHGLLHFLPFE
ncbi:MAG TPA: hypothetical protein PKI63_06185 [Candidatus Cloacimonadota bacterium]|nr:hypothetical protein [Candidatus Cloacimonadota bacterium]